LDSASGQAGVASTRKTRRRLPLNPLAIGILALIAVLVLLVMGLVLTGIFPPAPASATQTIEQAWNVSREETPAAQRANMLEVTKVGTPVRQGDVVTVTVNVKNSVMQSAALTGTVTANEPTPPPSQAKLYNGAVKVFFYKVNDKGQQEVTGSGVGNVTNLDYGQSKNLTIVASGVGDFTDYVALADSVWTDKDPVKPADTPTK